MRACVVVGCVLGAVAVASAQGADARQLFEDGVRALDEQRYAEAAELLERSLAIRESASAHYNRALALRGAGRYLEAITEAERFVEIASGRHAEARDAVQSMLAELQSSLATLRIEVHGDTERVELGGEVIATQDGTISRVVDPGHYSLRAFREGYAPVTEELEVAAGDRRTVRLDASSTPLPAEVRVEADPSSATIRWNGEVVGQGRAEISAQARAAPFQLEVEAGGFDSETREITLAPGESMRLTVALRETESTPLYRRWWLWPLVAIVVAGAAVGAWAATRPNEELYQGTLGHVQALSAWR